LKFENRHLNSSTHKTAVVGFRGMCGLTTELWQEHRGSPIDQDISEAKEREILKHIPRVGDEFLGPEGKQPKRLLKGPGLKRR
jgi:hypothetical protein